VLQLLGLDASARPALVQLLLPRLPPQVQL